MRRSTVAVVVSWLSLSCATSPAVVEDTSMNLQPSPRRTFLHRKELWRVESLAPWLAETAGQLLRVPLEVEVTALGLKAASVGAFTVQLDDAALGISLADRVRQACPGAARCTVWVEASWASDPGGHALRVLQFDRAAKPGEKVDFLEYEPAP